MTILLLLLALPAGSSPLVPTALAGRWRASGRTPDGPQGQPGMSWELTYVIKSDGTYTLEGYPPQHETGQVVMVSSQGQRYQVRFVHPGASDAPTVSLTVSADKNTLTWGERTFRRLPLHYP